MEILAEKGKIVLNDGTKLYLKNISIKVKKVEPATKTSSSNKKYGKVIDFVRNTLKRFQKSGVDKVWITDIVNEYIKTTGAKSRGRIRYLVRHLAGRYGFEIKLIDGKAYIVKKEIKKKKRKIRRGLKNIFKMILSSVSDEIPADEILKKVGGSGGYYRKVLKQACEEQGFSYVIRGRKAYCVRRGRKPKVLYSGFAYQISDKK